MSKLKDILEAIGGHSSGVQRKLLLARVGLKAGIDLTKINDETPNNPELENRLINIANEILGIQLDLDSRTKGK